MHFRLAYAEWRSGNHEEAIKERDQAGNLAVAHELADVADPQRWSQMLKVMISLKMNQFEKGQKTAAELKSMLEKQLNKKLSRMSDLLAGMIELRKNNLSQAIEYLRKAVSLMPFQYNLETEHGLFLDCLAQAYYKSGNLDKARQEYETLTSLTGGRAAWGDLYAKSFYMLGKIAEKKGEKAKAVEHDSKFLDPWKDADPGLTELEDARRRLNALR